MHISRKSGVPVVELRASIIIGSGSLSYAPVAVAADENAYWSARQDDAEKDLHTVTAGL